MQFLMGLNESYSQGRAQILLMDPLPSINEVYSLLIQEERECSVEKNSASASTSFSFTKEQCQQPLAMLGTQIQSVNFDFASKEHMDNNVIQPATHYTFMEGNFPFLQNFQS